MKPIWVIKVGGSILSKPENSAPLFDTLVELKTHVDVVLVHGGGDIAQDLLERLGFSSDKLDGIRITPDEQLPFIAGALAGIASKQLCSQALASGLNPVGLSLFDGGMCESLMFDHRYGAVGKAHPRNPELLQQLFASNMLPVINSIGADFDGHLLNVNADQAAIAICQLLNAQLFLLSDVPGVLDDKKSLINTLNEAQIESLIDQAVIQGGMVVKVKEAFTAANKIGQPVTIGSWRDAERLKQVGDGVSFGTQILSGHEA